MNIPLLKTKLYIPPARQDLVSRPRLVAMVEEGMQHGCKLTLVCAPAGFGKTTLLSEWIAVCKIQSIAWVSLDEGDNDVSRFWSYVISALQTQYPDIGLTSIGVLQSTQAKTTSIEPLLISLVNDVSSLVEGKDSIILVLDDYHTITTRSIHEGLDYLLEHLPPNLRLVLASREDPPLALSLLRGRGQLCEIRATDLRFNTVETGNFLKAAIGQDLSTNDIVALDKRTEGWVAGLQMAALSLKGQTDLVAHNFVSTFTGDDRYISDYLLDQVLHRQTSYIQYFLMQTSILDRFCGPLCDAVMASSPVPQGKSLDPSYSDSQQVLEYLERTGLFVIPLDNRRQWYRYHHLFADLLRSRMLAGSDAQTEDKGGKSEVEALHLIASTWFEEEGLVTEAMDHALAACDYERAADLIEKYFKETIWFGEFSLVFQWLEKLPRALVKRRPFLCLLYAGLSLSQSTKTAEEWLQSAEEARKSLSRPVDETLRPLDSFDDQVFSANVADIQVQIADINGVPNKELIAFTLEALEKIPESAPSLRASMLQKLGWYHLTLKDEGTAEGYFGQSKRLGEISGHYGNILGSTIGLALIAWGYGQLKKANTICRETYHTVVEPLERSGRRLPVAGNLYIILGRLLFELGEIEEAEAYLLKGVELVELTTPIRSKDLIDGLYTLACLRCHERDFEGAMAWMERTERASNWIPEYVRAFWVRIWLWRVQVEMDRHYLTLALNWAHECSLENCTQNEWELQSLAMAYIAGYRTDGQPDLVPILNLLDAQARHAEAAGRVDLVIYMLTLEALALQAMGQLDQAMEILERVLPIAESNSFVMTFVCHGNTMEALLREAEKRGISSAYASRLLEIFSKGMTAKSNADSHSTLAVPLEPLSKRELEVLHLLTSSLTGPQIADELFISLGTFQTHTKRIYSKLGVHNRLEAIERARAIKLL